MRVDRRRQEVVLVVQLFGGSDRVFGDLGELGNSRINGSACGLFHIQCGFRDRFEAAAGDLAVTGELGQHFSCGTGSADGGTDLLSHGRQLISAGACGVTGEDDRLVVLTRLFAALVVGKGQRASGSCCDGERINQAKHIAAQGLRRRRDAAEHILELASLLQQHSQRCLAALQRNENVSKLRRHPTERCGVLLGGVSSSSQRVIEAGQRLSGLVDLALVFAEDLWVEELPLLGKATFQFVQAAQRFDSRVDLAE
ncbi:hypothetical protein D3C77_412050 [compost metagenome]